MNKTQTFEIIRGDENNRFQLEPNQLFDLSYLVNVQNREVIDFNVQSIYNLTIRATDSGYPSRYSDLNLIIEVQDIINKAPRFNQTFMGTVDEHSSGGVLVATVIAYDDDTASSNDTLRYR